MCMTRKIVRVLEGRCLFVMRFHVKGRFPVLILFPQPLAVSVTAAKWKILGQGCSFDSFWISSVASKQRICHRGITGAAHARKHILTFEGTATDSESQLHSTFIHAISLPPEMFTRPRQIANDSLFVLRPWRNAIRVRTPPGGAHNKAFLVTSVYSMVLLLFTSAGS